MNGCSTHSIRLICPSSLAAFQWGVLATLNALLLLEIMDKPSVSHMGSPPCQARPELLGCRSWAEGMVPHLFRSKPRSQTPQHAFISLCIWDSKRFIFGVGSFSGAPGTFWRWIGGPTCLWHGALIWGSKNMAPRPIPSLQKTHGSGILGVPPLVWTRESLHIFWH